MKEIFVSTWLVSHSLTGLMTTARNMMNFTRCGLGPHHDVDLLADYVRSRVFFQLSTSRTADSTKQIRNNKKWQVLLTGAFNHPHAQR